MLTRTNINTINYIVACIEEFSERFKISSRDAFNYLDKFGGIMFLIENYEIEHTLSIDEAIEDITIICKNNGGSLQ